MVTLLFPILPRHLVIRLVNPHLDLDISLRIILALNLIELTLFEPSLDFLLHKIILFVEFVESLLHIAIVAFMMSLMEVIYRLLVSKVSAFNFILQVLVFAWKVHQSLHPTF